MLDIDQQGERMVRDSNNLIVNRGRLRWMFGWDSILRFVQFARIDRKKRPTHYLYSEQSKERILEFSGVITACVLAAVIATWPLARHIATAVPVGVENETTVPIFNLWELWWTADRAAHGFRGYWDAPIFYPFRGTFTFSEPQTFTGLLVTPLWAIGASPALIYNLALFALLTLNGIFAYRLTRTLQVPRLPALLGGVLMVTLPFVARMQGVLPIIPLFGMLWVLDGLVRFGREGAFRHAVWATTGFVVQYLTSQQLTVFFVLFAIVAGGLALAEQRFRIRALLRLAVAGAGAGLIVLWVAWPTLKTHTRLGLVRERPEAYIQALSAQSSDFLTRPKTALAAFPRRESFMNFRGGLFPGVILLMLAVIGATAGLTQSRQRYWTAYLVASVIAAMLLALGLNLKLGAWRPFATLRAILPGLNEMRSIARAAVIAQMCLAILAAMGLVTLGKIHRVSWTLVVVVLGIAGALENLSVPAPLISLPTTPHTPWTTWLRTQNSATVIAHIPFPASRTPQEYQIEAFRMYRQLDHHKPMINGYSGFFPPGYLDFQLAMAREFPNHYMLCMLNKRMGVNMLIVDQSWLVDHNDEMSMYRMLKPVYTDEEVRIYRLQAEANGC